MSRELTKMNLIAIVQQLPKDDIEVIQTYISMIEQENKELHNKIDKAIEVIHTQMKNNPSYKENLKIIEITLIKGSCRVCDLKDSDNNG